jgi:hypothetical protein
MEVNVKLNEPPDAERHVRWCERTGSKLIAAFLLDVCEAWLTAIGCKSRTRLVVGSVSRTARVSIARWNLKEAEGKRSVQRTETT